MLWLLRSNLKSGGKNLRHKLACISCKCCFSSMPARTATAFFVFKTVHLTRTLTHTYTLLHIYPAYSAGMVIPVDGSYMPHPRSASIFACHMQTRVVAASMGRPICRLCNAQTGGFQAWRSWILDLLQPCSALLAIPVSHQVSML